MLNKPAKTIVTSMQVETFEARVQQGHGWHECKIPEVSKKEDVLNILSKYQMNLDKIKQRKVEK